MTILECFEASNDEQIICLLGGKKIEIKYKDGTFQTGLVTNFLKAAQADDPHRSIIGFILDGRDNIVVSSCAINSIAMFNK